MAALLRVWLLGLVAAGAWFLAMYGVPLPTPVGAVSPGFSATRAEQILGRILGAEKPHPAGSDENAALHQRVMDELQGLGIQGEDLSGMSCYGGRANVSCALVHDIVAEAAPGEGKAILLMAHLDSVVSGPGAADDESGVAIILETLRTLKAESGHPVIVLFTDGEELGMLGANLFLNTPAWRDRVGAVINVEARGNQGRSYLFQTSVGDGKLIGLYAAHAARPATSSLYSTIYRYLPTDTDLTPFLQAGFAGYNFAFIGDAAQYHTALDRRANINPATLQSQGDQVLDTARALQGADLGDLKSGDAIYFDVLGRWLPRLPASFALPLSLACFVIIAVTGWMNGRGRKKERGTLGAILAPPLLILGALAAGFALEGSVALIAGDAPFAHPTALRVALAAALWAMALLTMRGAGGTACWLWLSGLAIVAAIFAPGLCPYFLFPSLVAALLFLLTIGFGRGTALLLSALAMLVVWIGFAAEGEQIMGIAAHPLFTVPAAIGLIALLPVLRAQKMGDGAWQFSVILSLLVALGFGIAAALQPAFSATAPERLNIRYVEKDGKSWWLADPVANLPGAMRGAAAFSKDPLVLAAWRGYVAPAGVVQLPAPSADVVRSGSTVTLDLHGSAAASGMVLMVPAGLGSVSINGAPAQKLASGDERSFVGCTGHDCANAHVVLGFTGPVAKSLLLAETRYGLPEDAAFLLKARPDWARPSGQGDMSFAATDVAVPKN